MTVEEILALQRRIKNLNLRPVCLGRVLVAIVVIGNTIKGFYGKASDYKRPKIENFFSGN